MNEILEYWRQKVFFKTGSILVLIFVMGKQVITTKLKPTLITWKCKS
jgi:hypothetical protein